MHGTMETVLAADVAKWDDTDAGEQAARQPETPFRAVRFAGLRFTPMSVAEATAALAARQQDAPFAAFVTPNAEHAWLRRHDPEFARCGEAAWISTNDSRVLRNAALLGGLKLDFAPGAYVVRDLFREVIRPDDALTVIGGTDATIAALCEQFGLNRIAHHNPPMGFIHDPDAVRTAVDFVAAHPARFVFVAMGPPQSEKFCQRVISDGRSTGLGLCIGSSLTVITGQMKAAPDIMEHTGFVWLYRLAREPGRLWRRYLARGLWGLGYGLWDAARLRLGLRKAWPG
ncbi:glycosyltransferase [Caulobacter mirabilis]|uniref:Glycosyltransferase n=1 Tax=Caulobacter mirabilis TaxID=69666 RepID=A0A2D2AZ87_9CAUL|nr:glycosyltransferase [Caulobacter mirabilis]